MYGSRERHRALYICSFFLGLTWIILVKYGFYTPRIINIPWAGTSVFSAMYIIPIFVLIYRIGKGWKAGFLELLGKASFHIFLAQMLYYAMAKDYVYSVMFSHTNNPYIITLINIIICCLLGVCFYFVEKPLGKWVLKRTSTIVKKIEWQKEL